MTRYTRDFDSRCVPRLAGHKHRQHSLNTRMDDDDDDDDDGDDDDDDNNNYN